MEHIAIRIQDDDEMENEEYVTETVQRIRRRSLVKVVGGCLLFGSGIVVGAASNMMIINDASNRELKFGEIAAFAAKQIAERGGKQAVAKMLAKKAARSAAENAAKQGAKEAYKHKEGILGKAAGAWDEMKKIQDKVPGLGAAQTALDDITSGGNVGHAVTHMFTHTADQFKNIFNGNAFKSSHE